MENRTVYFISGGNRGIGFKLVELLSERENSVIITSAREPNTAVELKNLIKKNRNVHVVKLDVTSKESTLNAAKEIGKIVDKIDVFVSNSAIADSYSSVIETDEEVWVKHWRTNVLGSIFTYQALYPLLLNGNNKQVIFISSVAGSIKNFFPISVSAYGQSKAALNYTTKEISFELKEKGFTVIAVHPGMVTSDMGSYGQTKILESNPELKNVIEEIAITPQESASYILGLFDKLELTDNGKFFSYDGQELDW